MCNVDAEAPLLSTIVDEAVLDFVRRGGRLLLLSHPARGGVPERTCIRDSADVPYPLYFASTFWGAPDAPGGGNLGTVIADHPALGNFPHEGFCDLQFLSLLRGVGRADLEVFPTPPDPIIRSGTDWRIGAHTAYLFEARLGQVRMLMTTLNFSEALTQTVRKRPIFADAAQPLLRLRKFPPVRHRGRTTLP